MQLISAFVCSRCSFKEWTRRAGQVSTPGMTLEKKQKGKRVKKNPKPLCQQGLKHGGFREIGELKMPRRGKRCTSCRHFRRFCQTRGAENESGVWN